MTKTNTIIGLIVLVLIMMFFNFSNIGGNKLPDDLNERTAGQVLDVKIDLDNKIGTLKKQQAKEVLVLEKQRDNVIKIYNIKRGRVNTGTTATGNTVKAKQTPTTPVSTNKEGNELGL